LAVQACLPLSMVGLAANQEPEGHLALAGRLASAVTRVSGATLAWAELLATRVAVVHLVQGAPVREERLALAVVLAWAVEVARPVLAEGWQGPEVEVLTRAASASL
jgi:hypothetical protein